VTQTLALLYWCTTKGSGAGLGLAIVGEICRAHQAEISLRQVQRQGLLVRIKFACAEA
jgi:two-component system sensor histidine kinase TctE